jgi:formylmethanofuran dehydrogenase subunit C
LNPKYSFKFPIYAEVISPDLFVTKSIKEISELYVWEGNKRLLLGDLFELDGNTENTLEKMIIKIEGDLSKVRRIGANMTSGKIIIKCNVGLHLGESMKGGEIIVQGNADSWIGCMMKGGKIEIKGSCSDYVGAPYRGSINGMKNGNIIIHGDVGNEIGAYMRGGFINIEGNAKDFLGVHMKDGVIVVHGDCGDRVGAEMLEGKIIICGNIQSILPTFSIDSIRPSVKAKDKKIEGPFYRFIGDIVDNGKGKVYVKKHRNQHLSYYEKYL